MDGEVEAVRAAVALALTVQPATLVPGRLCRVCVTRIGMSGAALCLVETGSVCRLLGTSDRRAGGLCEMQFTLGWGPGPEAVQAVAPVLVADLTEPSAQQRWPLFAAHAQSAGVRAVHCVPVIAGTQAIGTLDLYGTRPTVLAEAQLRAARVVAQASLAAIARLCAPMIAALTGAGHWPQVDHDATRVHQAAGMLAERLTITPSEALVRLRARAFADGITLTALARQLIEHGQWPEE